MERSICKIIVMGEEKVGKTSLLNLYVKNQTLSKMYKQTVGAEFLSSVKSVSGLKLTAQLWDIAGRQTFRQITFTNLYKGADALVLVFDLTDLKSFENLDGWLEEFKLSVCTQYIKNDLGDSRFVRLPMMLIGNKCDLVDKRVVTREAVEQWCQSKSKLSIEYFEMSAMFRETVTGPFDSYLLPAIVEYQNRHHQLEELPQSPRLRSIPSAKDNKKGQIY
ncbi:Rho GTPase [Heterostelium album PN500]|uniref:Rho GTPase n=1 Tax=Heterostelium pallidum (strain ATCC 26659 / Pp 5 / PN500) TaxID=670386 RepID=D3BQV2_HETP5|nr:Rho GTPase [Heterostelium album PN500]EFA76522.1 Rho GTPase [Heterostelium album PN500]|eukprot:XP_020428654.1 Rho GTPase [Heterostelium album PN500]